MEKNIDGIKKIAKKPVVVRPVIRITVVKQRPPQPAAPKFFDTAPERIGKILLSLAEKKDKIKRKISFDFPNKKVFQFNRSAWVTAFLVLALTASFGFGFWAALTTPKSIADDEQQAAKPVVYEMPLPDVKLLNQPNISTNDALFTMPINQLEAFLKQQQGQDKPSKPVKDLLAERTEKLKIYLAEKKSPFVEIADTIAGLKHWKLVLAISNAESTLGKHCSSNNCSGIGVDPSHPLWRKYESTRDWAKDLDRLLEKRYKDWTLEKMNGVYNQPGSQNWLLATRQILAELAERNVE